MVKGRKLLAMILVFTLTFSYFSVVTESIASTGFVSLFGLSSDESDENVEFEALLSDTKEMSETLIGDVNSKDLKIDIGVNVKNSGYLKNGKIEIKPKEDENLNFEINPENKIAEMKRVQSLENNTIELNKIDSSSEKLEISVPIQYNMEEYINKNKMCSTAVVVLSGVYVDDNGKENEISREMEITLAWKDEREVKVSDEVSKYIAFGNDGVILQTAVKVDSSAEEENSLPVKKTELNIEVPKLDGKAPSEISVVANSTKGTNGKGTEEVEFSEDNWSYDKNKNMLNINVKNSKQLVDIKNSEEYLKVENEEKKQEERYYSVAGADEFLVTYTFQDVKLADEMKIDSNISAEVATFSGVKSEKNVNKASAEQKDEKTLTEQTGNLVSYNVENKTQSISKVYAYLNKEKEFESNETINISYKDIVEEIMLEDTENYYVDKSGNKTETDDIYYKQISINKDNMTEILGEDGYVIISDVSGNELVTVNKDTQTDDSGNYVIGFQDKITKIAVKTSAPVNTGNLSICKKKAMSAVSIEKSEYANMANISTDTHQKAKFTYVSDVVDLESKTSEIKLNDTATDFNLVIDKESLVTGTTNSNVEMRFELKNNEITSDIYGNSVFDIEMPEYVKGVSITNSNILYGEGLEITNVESVNDNGRIHIRVTVEGKQTDLSSGELTNGTNIVLNANIDVDKYTPATKSKINAYVFNSEATNYKNPAEYAVVDGAAQSGSASAEIEYSAPSGLVAINTLSNYNDEGASVTSIKEGTKTDYIDIYSEAKTAKSEIVLINNNENTVSDIAILGRVPFKGVKQIEKDEDLGTTIDVKMMSEITSANENFTVYYSENGDANKDLKDSSNAWNQSPESFENIKSYLIVPNDEKYEMKAKEVVIFSYDFEIPENLDHNENIYGTFLTYYTNNSEIGITKETSKPDLVGLTTGVGPEINLDVKTSTKLVKELEEFEVVATVKNTGEDLVKDIVLNMPIPENTTFVSAESDRDSTEIAYEEGKVVANIVQLTKDSEVNVTLKLKVDNISQTTKNVISATASVTAKDLGKTLEIKADDIKIKRAEMSLEQEFSYGYPDEYFEKGNSLEFSIYAANLSDENKKDITVETELPKEMNFVKAYMMEGSVQEGLSIVENATYDANTNKVTWKIDEINAGKQKNLKLNIQIGDLEEGLKAKQTTIKSTMKQGEESYNAKDILINIGKSSLRFEQQSETTTYVTEGDNINYKFTIVNDGELEAKDVVLTDSIPEGLIIRNVAYTISGVESNTNMAATDNAEISLTIPAKSEVAVNVTATALDLNGVAEKTVTNEATLKSSDTELKSNSITHIIKADPEKKSDEDNDKEEEQNNNSSVESSSESEIKKSYKISGVAWLDENKNGVRDSDEKTMPDVTAMVVDSTTGVIKGEKTTNSNGEYSFTGLQNGTYLVLFKYDTVLYITTTYRVENAENSVNSDAVTTKIEQDGKKENGAVTDKITIEGANVVNIDIGLIEAEQFSLELDKSITKITVQNAQGTKTEELDHSKLAKYDIAAKYMSGTTVYVEYTFKVSNNGTLSGYATELVDYIPQGMNFNSNLNPDWYTGTDGNLYTKALQNKELASGESTEIKLVLTKQMTTENTGLVSNSAEVADDYNIYGVSDKNSTPNNKAQNEDDISTADIILTVKTGESLIYVSGIIIGILAGGAVAYIVYGKVIRKRKGGV